MLAGVLGIATLGWSAPSMPACSDPCLDAARGSRKDCVSSAAGAFQQELDGCLEREQTCLDACRAEHEDCREATGLGDALAACQQTLAADKARCRERYLPGSRKRDRCIDQAQAHGFRCRRRVPREVRHALRDCRRAFVGCASACAPGGPPDGVEQCKDDADDDRQAAVEQCKSDFVLSASACIDKDATCVQDCGDARDQCNQPTQASFQAAYAACTSARNAALAQCQADFPDDGTALEQCLETAQATAFTCRDDALEAAMPGFAACGQAWAQCVQGCPAG